MQILINEINASDAKSYKEFINTGLIDDEENFRITPEDDRDTGFPTKGQPDSFTLGAFVGSDLAGVVSFERDGSTRQKLRHKGILFRMYVHQNFRGMGIAKKLIQLLLDRVRQLHDIEHVNLTVIADNHGALALYEKFGFKTFATEERAIKWKGKYFSEKQMALRL